MRNIFLIVGLSLSWTLMVGGLFVLEGLWTRPPVSKGEIKSLQLYLENNLEEAETEERLGSAALVLIHQGNIVYERSFGLGNDTTKVPPSIDSTLYLMCSVSKAVTAWGMLKLVEDGKIALDEPVLPHLKRWRFPGSDRYRDRVTVRHLLSHTAGLVDGFGYSGFLLDENKQTPEESLNYPEDPNNGQPHAAVIVNEPGTVFSYSSAGYTILQILIEELTGKSFNEYMKQDVMNVLGMSASSYEIEDIISQGRQGDLAPNYDVGLDLHPYRKHTMMAGGSLRITPHDLASFVQAYNSSTFLSSELVKKMGVPQPGTGGGWGIGHEIYSDNNAGGYIFGHGGGAFPRTGASFRVNPATGNGIGLVMTGGSEMIDPYMAAWLYWETGKTKFDIREVVHRRIVHAVIISAIGIILITLYHVRISYTTR